MILTIAVSTVLLIVGAEVIAVINTSMPAYSGVTGQANATFYNTFNNVYSAFSLSSVIPILAIAGLLIALIVGAFYAFRKSGVET